MKQLRNGFAFRVIYMGAVFLISLFIAKFAGTGGFGAVSLMIVNAALIQIITGLGTDSAILIQGISLKEPDRSNVFSLTIYSSLLQLLLFIAAAGIFLYSTGKTILGGGHDLPFFFTECIYFSGLVLAEKYSALFYSQQKAAICNKLLAYTISLLLIIFFGSLFFSKTYTANNPAQIMAVITFVPAAVLIIFYHVAFNPEIKKTDRAGILAFTRISAFALVTNLVQFVAYRVDFWLINYYHGKEDVGIYAQAAKFSQMLWIIPVIVAGLIIPALKREENQMGSAGLLSFCRGLFFSHIGIALLLAGGGFFVYSYFLPPDYMQGFVPLLIMLPGYIFFIITIILASWFAAHQLMVTNLVGSLICCIVMLLADLILIPRYSFTGAAVANLISYIITTTYFIFMMSKQTKAGLRDYFYIRKQDLKCWRQRDEKIP